VRYVLPIPREIIRCSDPWHNPVVTEPPKEGSRNVYSGGGNPREGIVGTDEVEPSAEPGEDWWNENSYRFMDSNDMYDIGKALDDYAAHRCAALEAENARLEQRIRELEK
jgi:hypothetical protein